MGSNPPKMQVEIKKRDNWFHLFQLTGYEFFPSKDHVRNLLRSGNFQKSILPEDSAEKGRAITLAEIKDISWDEQVEIQEHILEDEPEQVEKQLREMFREKYNFYLIENEGETEVRPYYLLKQLPDKVIERSESNQNFDTELSEANPAVKTGDFLYGAVEEAKARVAKKGYDIGEARKIR